MSIRKVLAKLKALARRTDCAIVCVRHLTKDGSQRRAIHAGMGSVGFVGAARAAYLVHPDPDDEDLKVVACVKHNVGIKPGSLAYRIAVNSEGDPWLRWQGPSERTAQDLLTEPDRRKADREDREEAARSFLAEICGNGREQPWPDIVRVGKGRGLSEWTLRRVRDEVLEESGRARVRETGSPARFWTLRGNGVVVVESLRTQEPEASLLHKSSTTTTPGLENPDIAEPNGHSANGRIGQQAQMVSVTGRTRDEVIKMPKVCEVCGSTDRTVIRHLSPHFVVRCKAHRPETYHGGD